jgi:hypothetical protein
VGNSEQGLKRLELTLGQFVSVCRRVRARASLDREGGERIELDQTPFSGSPLLPTFFHTTIRSSRTFRHDSVLTLLNYRTRDAQGVLPGSSGVERCALTFPFLPLVSRRTTEVRTPAEGQERPTLVKSLRCVGGGGERAAKTLRGFLTDLVLFPLSSPFACVPPIPSFRRPAGVQPSRYYRCALRLPLSPVSQNLVRSLEILFFLAFPT